MADFSRNYFKRREPPPHIWLGTSVENHEAFDERILRPPHFSTALYK